MKDAIFFRGMMPIMPTVVTESGALDEAGQRRVVEYCLQCGAVAIGHFGYASEFHMLSEEQRRRLTGLIVREVAGRVPVFIGVAAPAVHIAVEYARQAADLGADLIMATLPYIDVPDSDGAFAYYQALSDASPLPIIVQDAGHCAPVLTADFMLRMHREIENIRYVKAEGARFLDKAAALIAGSGGTLPVIGGAGGKHLIHMLRLGVTAFMTGTEALDLHGGVVRAYLAGDEAEAARLYFERVLPYLVFYLDHSKELLKEMLHRRGLIDSPAMIAPAGVVPMSETERREFDWILKRIGFDQDPRKTFS
ncbi:MAG TPA: dihydrodipicolinate synthase family protein [Candidatus Hydrogenedentes bacterium]|nr:dihydrodipicolinate synthase family protein [Candidatus Hydrogenedentota bacterium]